MLSKDQEFEFLMRKHSKALHNFLISRFGFDLNTVEDVVQDSFVKAYLKFESYDPNKSFKAWIFAIGVNTAKSYKFKRFESLDAVSDVQLLGYYKQEDVELTFERQDISDALALLTKTDRHVLELMYFQEYSAEQIAAELKMPINSVKQKINRALKRLSVEFMAR